MAKNTSKYQLGYFQKGDITRDDIEMQRFETLDAQLHALFSVIGNGVLSGWDIIYSSGLSITVTPGSGHVNYIAVESTQNATINNLTSSSINYIYAQLEQDSYWNKTVTFAAYVTPNAEDQSLLIGTVTTDATSVISIDTSDKKELGFIGLIKDAISEHKHIGGTDNPDPIDLSSEVQGVLNQNNLPDLDASIIQAGTLDPNRIPKLSHVDNLTDQGTLTHSQLESILQSISASDHSMGEVAQTNLLQLVLALKHAYPEIDDYLLNEIAFIPGISPDEYIDTINTTAIVDTRTQSEGGQHTITGTPASLSTLYIKKWNSSDDYDSATQENVYIDGNSITIEPTIDTLVIDDFSTINDWNITTQDNSSLTANVIADASSFVSAGQSAKIDIDGEEVEMTLIVKKTLSTQDWSNFNYLKFYIKTTSVQHGDIYFYFNDSIAGIQNSYINILGRNEPTIDETTLENGWQEVTIDISLFDRTSINYIGFTISTKDGWDTTKSFDFNVDDIHLSTGNIFEENGYIRLVYGNDFPYRFWRTRWDSSLPDDTSIKSRARFANTIPDLSSATWTEYATSSGTDFGLADTDLFKYCEIELLLTSSLDQTLAPYIHGVYLDFYATDIENSHIISSQEDWQAGESFNIDSISSPGNIKLSKTSDIGNIIYAQNGTGGVLNSEFEELNTFIGTALPISTKQALNGTQSKFGLITAIDRGNNGNLWIADTDNDRVVEIDTTGTLVRGFYGSFINDPVDNYGTEDFGPGSNIYTSTTFTKEIPQTVANIANYDLEVLHSVYNPEHGILYAVFNKNIENIYAPESTFNLNNFKLKVGAHSFNLNNAEVELLGVNEDKYNNWVSLYASTDTDVIKNYGINIQQFKFTSNVLKITLNGSEKSALNKMVRTANPMVAIATPYANENVASDFTLKLMYYNFEIGAGAGEPYAKVTIDGSDTIIYSDEMNVSGLSSGKHTIKVELFDEDDVAYGNVGSVIESEFIVEAGYNESILSIVSPKPNQIFSSGNIVVTVDSKNFPILPSGQHIKYSLDGEPAVDEYSSKITLTDLTPGIHELEVYIVDKNGNSVWTDYRNCTCQFIVGSNPNAITKLHWKKDTIKDISLASSVLAGNCQVDVANIIFSNIYSPIDLQVISDSKSISTNKIPTIVISKLRSPTFNSYLSNKYSEVAVMIADSTRTVADEDKNLVYGDNLFLDGHSVVQLDMEGNVVFSNNAAIFATSREEAKEILGGCRKISSSELLIADSYNKRAIITKTMEGNQLTSIVWQYDSDRYIIDADMAPQNDVVINIYDGYIDEPTVYIKQGASITWKNLSSNPITIYSGSTTTEIFNEDPDLNKYGLTFESSTLDVGDEFTFVFNSIGDFDWFVYPSILTGTIYVTEQRISERDNFYLIESDGLESPHTSRIIKVDTWGNVLWSFGESYLIKPRDIRPMLNNKLLIST